MGKRYKETDNDIDSTERYYDRFPSINCISFFGQSWKLLQKMEDCERKIDLTQQWHWQLKQFIRMQYAFRSFESAKQNPSK